MGKYQEISLLAEETAKNIIKNEENWKQYLKTASRLYRYPFKDQMLIHAQRPDATACASIRIWNEKMDCRVKRGAKGIALIDTESSYPKLKYVFDVADVYKANKNGHTPNLWKMQERHKIAVIAQLEKTHGATGEEMVFEERIITIAGRIAEDYYEELLAEAEDAVFGSSLEGLNRQDIGLRLRETMASSLAYMALSRCGKEPEMWQDELEFGYIHTFDSPKVLATIGSAIAEMGSVLLMEIGWTIRKYEQQAMKQETARRKGAGEGVDTGKQIKGTETVESPVQRRKISGNIEKPLENIPEREYNALKRESDYGIQKKQGKEREREGNVNGTGVRGERRLPDTKPDTKQRAGGRTYKVWIDAEEIPERAPEGDLSGNGVGRRTEGPLPVDTRAGRGKNGIVGRSDAKEGRSDRTAQSREPAPLGAENEQHPAVSGRNRAGGAGIPAVTGETAVQQKKRKKKEAYQQQSLFQSFENQALIIKAAQEGKEHPMPAAFFLSQEQLEAILRTGGGQYNSRQRIYAKYQQGKTPKEMVEFLKYEYQTVGKGFHFRRKAVSVWFDEDGMRAGYGNSAIEAPMAVLNWLEVEGYIRTMVKTGNYMSAREVSLVEMEERQRVAGRLFDFFREDIRKTPASIPIESCGYQEGRGILCEFLTRAEGRRQIALELSKIKEQMEETGERAEWWLYRRLNRLLVAVSDLNVEIQVYPAKDEVEVIQEDFITQDEIDAWLMEGKGSQYEHYLMYEHFTTVQDRKESIAFLKKAYGIGENSYVIPWTSDVREDHNAKGVRLVKGNYGNPYAKVKLTWEAVERRFRELVQSGRYLDQMEAAGYLPYGKGKKESKSLEQENAVSLGQKLTGEDTPDDKQPGNLPEKETLEEKQKKGPDLLKEAVVNYRIPDVETEHVKKGFKPKEKFHQNVAAIHTLFKIEKEHRNATSGEQEILAAYVGWGGLADAFDAAKTSWANEYQELKTLLPPEDYASAKESTLNAHYTSPVIIRAIYDVIGKMGFLKGNILDPSSGIGNFFGCLPEEMQESRLYGAELDGITGRIAKQLYPHADIRIMGFENTNFPNDFFDVAVGNVPFGQYKVADQDYKNLNFLIHDYFFAKTLDKVRSGGLVAFVTSKGTMDKKTPKVRKYLAQRAELLGAVRLPNTAFLENAGTEVTTDILFLKKRDRIRDIEPDWVYLTEKDGIVMNQYFVDHPEMILGKMEMVPGAYGMESVCLPDPSFPLAAQLEKALSLIEGSIGEADFNGFGEEEEDDIIPADPDVKNFSYTVLEERVYYRENSIMKPVRVPEKTEQRIKGMVEIRDCTQALIHLQLEEYPESEIERGQGELNRRYDRFFKEFGMLNAKANKRAFSQDASYCLLCSLEKLDGEGNYIGKADMFTRRTIKSGRL